VSQETPSLTAVVFDIGGVLLEWDPHHLYAELIPDQTERDWFLAEVCTFEWNLTLDAGRPFDEACAELADRHPNYAELIHAWKRQDQMIVGEVEGTVALVDLIQAQGLPLYLLTNMPAEVFAARLADYPVLQRFAGAVVSGDEGVLKPSSEIFDRLAGRFGLDPSTTLFIDDSEINVAGAHQAGFLVHHFVDAPTLAAALRTLGVDLEVEGGVRPLP
jgi:2-haloacid dehalogenase